MGGRGGRVSRHSPGGLPRVRVAARRPGAATDERGRRPQSPAGPERVVGAALDAVRAAYPDLRGERCDRHRQPAARPAHGGRGGGDDRRRRPRHRRLRRPADGLGVRTGGRARQLPRGRGQAGGRIGGQHRGRHRQFAAVGPGTGAGAGGGPPYRWHAHRPARVPVPAGGRGLRAEPGIRPIQPARDRGRGPRRALGDVEDATLTSRSSVGSSRAVRRVLVAAADGAAALVVGARGLGGFTGLIVGRSASRCCGTRTARPRRPLSPHPTIGRVLR